MGIITKEVEVKIGAKNADYYKNLGYEIPMKKASESYFKRNKREFVYDFGKTISVSVSDLPKNSEAVIRVLCPMCKKNEMTVPYKNYNMAIENTGSYTCKDCTYEKVRATNLSLYGSPYYTQTQDYRDKRDLTMKNLYGGKYSLQNEKLIESYKTTCIEKYGESYRQQFAKMALKSFYEKTGYNNPSQSPEVREKIIQSYIAHYGVDNAAKSQEVRKKISETLYMNSSQKVSKQQNYINNLYHGILNFPIKYYNVDIYLSNDNLIIEYDGGGHLLNVITGRETIEEYKQKEIVRNNTIKREGYKQMKIMSSSDLIPSDEILLRMLFEAKQYFLKYPNHSWIEYDIDNSIMRNAECKAGVQYNYGELRKIKDLDSIESIV